MKLILTAIFIILLCGCSMPTTSVKTNDSRPSIAVNGAPSEAELLVDGLNMGKANAYNGKPQVLRIEAGTHKISIIEGGQIIHEQTIFVDAELKTINVH